MKVSIITVSYNSAKTIGDTISSVRKQSYKNIEYIVVDGNSADGTVEIVKRFMDALQDSAKDASQGRSEGAMQGRSEGASQDLPEDLSKNLEIDVKQDDALFTWLRSVSDEEGIKEQVREVKRGEEEGRISTESVQPSLDLIEKFIATEPRITPGKVEQYTGVSFAKESLEENFDWVTETMAKLYAAQGKIDRARKAYKRLIELHPEKKIHFENQLKVLNQRK